MGATHLDEGPTGVGQRHFYFQAGKRVVWLAANRRFADAALDEALKFYP